MTPYVRPLNVSFPRTIDNMDEFELSRWFALIEGVNTIAEECEDRGINFNTIDLKPVHLKRFINSSSDHYANKYNRYLRHQKEKV